MRGSLIGRRLRRLTGGRGNRAGQGAARTERHVNALLNKQIGELRPDSGDARATQTTGAEDTGPEDTGPENTGPTPPTSGEPLALPFLVRACARLRAIRGIIDRVIQRSSLVSNAPVLDVRDFPWTADLRGQWQTIRREALASAVAQGRGHPAQPNPGRWDSFFLWGHGHRIEENIARCPETAKILARIPGLASGFFSTLPPGTHLPERRGLTKGLITCHLGLVVPRDGDARMRLDARVLRWAEGETLLFDDSRAHELWNDSSGARIVLVLQFRRPLRNPGKWIADALLRAMARSAPVRAALADLRPWGVSFNEAQGL